MTQFDLSQALRNLDIEVMPFGYEDPNAFDEPGLRGYSRDRWISINPQERWPVMVSFHEMAHILRGDTVLYKKFGVDWDAYSKGTLSIFDPNVTRLAEYKMRNHDLTEATCHIAGILACQLTDTPFDLGQELMMIERCYMPIDKLPDELIRDAYKIAKKIAAAGKIDARHLGWAS